MKTMNEVQVIKTVADALDLLILRSQVDQAMARKVALDNERLRKLAHARDLLVELYMDAGLKALHGESI